MTRIKRIFTDNILQAKSRKLLVIGFLKALLILFIIGSLVSCLLTEIDGDSSPPSNFSFIWMGSVEAVEQTRNMAINDFDRMAYTSDGNGIIGFYNISNPRMPTLMHSLRLPTFGDYISKIEVDNNRNLHIAAGRSGLYIVNALNPQMPRILYQNSEITAFDLSIEDDHIAVINENGWALYNRSVLDHLFEIRTHNYIDSPSPRKVLLRHPWLFVANNDRLDIFDLNSPPQSRPEQTIYYQNFVDFDVDSNGVFMALITRSELIFIDITNPLNASEIRRMGVNLNPRVIRIAQGRLFISTWNRTVSVFRLTTLLEIPEEETRRQFHQVVHDISFHHGYILFSQGINGIEIYRYLH